MIRTLIRQLTKLKCPSCGQRSVPKFHDLYYECEECLFTYYYEHETKKRIELSREQVNKIREDEIEQDRRHDLIISGTVPFQPSLLKNPNIDVLYLNNSHEVLHNNNVVEISDLSSLNLSRHVVLNIERHFCFGKLQDVLVCLIESNHVVSGNNLEL